MPRKRCAWGLCNSDNKYKALPDMQGITFRIFPQPRTQMERCLQWIKSCNRPHEQLNVKKITPYLYVCSKHFVEGTINPVSAYEEGDRTAKGRKARKSRISEPPKNDAIVEDGLRTKMDSKEASNDSQSLSSSSGSPLPRDIQKPSENFNSSFPDEITRQELKKLSLDQHGTFMMDFDPEKSQRELRKMNRRIHSKGSNKNQLYDERGIFLEYPIDLCDCLSKDCPGCHFPCHKCGSEKCGTECRCGRRYTIDLIEIEGTNDYYSSPL